MHKMIVTYLDFLLELSPIVKCIDEENSMKIVSEVHSGICGDHYMEKTIAHKVIREGFQWHTLFCMTM